MRLEVARGRSSHWALDRGAAAQRVKEIAARLEHGGAGGGVPRRHSRSAAAHRRRQRARNLIGPARRRAAIAADALLMGEAVSVEEAVRLAVAATLLMSRRGAWMVERSTGAHVDGDCGCGGEALADHRSLVARASPGGGAGWRMAAEAGEGGGEVAYAGGGGEGGGGEGAGGESGKVVGAAARAERRE